MEVDAGHLRTIRKNDSGLCRVGSSSNQINNDVRNFRDDNLYWWISSVHSRVERSGTGLAFRHMRWAQEIRELFQEIVSIICTKKSLSLCFLLADIQTNSNHLNKCYSWPAVVFIQVVCIGLYLKLLPWSNMLDFSSFRVRDFQTRNWKWNKSLLDKIELDLSPLRNNLIESNLCRDGQTGSRVKLDWEGNNFYLVNSCRLICAI